MKARQRPRRSIRSILVFWLLIFSILPLGAITWYSVSKYEQAIDRELSTRLAVSAQQVTGTLNDFRGMLTTETHQIANDRAVQYYLAANSNERAREMLRRWFQGALGHRLWVFNRDARLTIALYRDAHGQVQRRESIETGTIEINEPLRRAIAKQDEMLLFNLPYERTGARGQSRNAYVDLSLFTKIKSANGRVLGYVEEAFTLDEKVLNGLKNKLNLELFVFQADKPAVASSHKDFRLYSSAWFTPHLKRDGYFEMNVQGEPFRLMFQKMKWGTNDFVLGLAVSKKASMEVLNNVSIAFVTVLCVITLLLIVLSVIASRILLTPVYDVLGAIERADFDKGTLKVPVSNDTELGLLAEAFNDLQFRTVSSQQALKGKIQELEHANVEIRDTQAKLVHAAKMASLGQLVAGVAHELNNPIGFIYSNMTHLRDYSQKLLHLIEVAEHEPHKLEKEIEKADLAYIAKDLPKLISSCEDGARRTRDIVLGLRNFSRLEEAQLKEVDLHEGLDNTLQLLSGELKNRVRVEKKYGKIPKVTCFPSQLNQVFMNVLSNAAQAIEDDGEITIATKKSGSGKVEVSIRDTGKGMSKATLEKIFDPFFTTKALGSGTGLGLSISYGVVQKHGGDILVKSEPGEGTEFRIILPVAGPQLAG